MGSESSFCYKQPEQEKVPRLEGGCNPVAIGRSVTFRKNFSYLFFGGYPVGPSSKVTADVATGLFSLETLWNWFSDSSRAALVVCPQ